MVLINHSCFTVLYNNSVLYLSKFGNLHAYSILPKPKATPLVPWNGRGICSVCKTIKFLTTFHKDDVLLLLRRWDEIQSQSQMKFDNFGSGIFFSVIAEEEARLSRLLHLHWWVSPGTEAHLRGCEKVSGAPFLTGGCSWATAGWLIMYWL